jgi:glycosyltransferase involved in cell wall biosynthesis
MGALNEGRGIETALEALRLLKGTRLVLAGEGDLSEKLRQLAVELGVNERVTFLGYTPPEALRALAAQSWLCLNLLENRGLSYYYSLANKFFLSVQAGVPVLTMNFPEYRALNAQHEVAVLLDELTPESVAGAIGKLLSDKVLYEHLRRQCLIAGSIWTWENEEAELLRIWASVR